MKDVAEMLLAAERLAAAGEEAVLVTLVRTRGSTYRRAGARMLVLPGCRTIGTISGGCLEGMVARDAWAATRGGRRVVLEVESAPEDDAWGPASGCHGTLFLLAEPVPAGERHPVLQVLAEVRRGDRGAVVEHGFEITGDGGLEPGFVRSRPADSQDGGASAWVEEGSAGVFREWLPPLPHLLVCGGGEDARPVVRMAAELGWRISVLDSRARWATCERFPEAFEVCAEGPAALPRFLRRHTAAVVMSHRFADDVEYFSELLRAKLSYIGLLGPRRRTERMLAELASRPGAVAPGAEELACVFSPIGLNVGAHDASTIALSIVAEVQTVLAGRDGRPLSQKMGPVCPSETAHAWQK